MYLLFRKRDFGPPLSVQHLSLPPVQLFEECHDLLILDLRNSQSLYAHVVTWADIFQTKHGGFG